MLFKKSGQTEFLPLPITFELILKMILYRIVEAKKNT